MGVLIVGLIIFLGIHSIRLAGARAFFIAMMGEGFYAVVYSIISAVGLALTIYGFSLSHPSTTIWLPPEWTRDVALVSVPLGFILVFSTYVPSHIRSLLKHPMTIGIILWSGAHLLANGELNDLVLFGAFFIWALATLIRAYMRGGEYKQDGTFSADLIAIGVGLGVSALIAIFHMQLFGVAIIGFASETPIPGI